MTLSAELQRCQWALRGGIPLRIFAPGGRTISLAVRAPPSTTAVVFPAGQVSPAGSVGASAFGRGVHRTPAPFEKVSLHPVKTFRTGDRYDACDGCLGI